MKMVIIVIVGALIFGAGFLIAMGLMGKQNEVMITQEEVEEYVQHTKQQRVKDQKMMEEMLGIK